MLEFTLIRKLPHTGGRYCILSEAEPYHLLFFDENGAERKDLIAATEPAEGQYVLLDCLVSGGSFRQFLESAMVLWAGKVCLYLRKAAVRFPLPCADGMGSELPYRELPGSIYSEELCENLFFPDNENCVFLWENEYSLSRKRNIAIACDVPLCIRE